MFPFPIIAPIALPATLTYVGSTQDPANASVYTYTDHSIGAAASDRLVVVCVGGNGGTLGITSVTLGGNAMNEVLSPAVNENTCVGIYSLLVPSGTTATIVVTFAASKNRSAISVYTLTGYTSSTAYSTGSDSGTDATATASINYQDGGAVIAVSHINGQRTATWTNVTENYDATVESTSSHTAASKSTASSATGESISVTFSDIGSHALAVASWR